MTSELSEYFLTTRLSSFRGRLQAARHRAALPSKTTTHVNRSFKLISIIRVVNDTKKKTRHKLLSMDAWIPNYRELTQEEKALLAFLVEGRPDLEAQLDDLKVTARCVCGCSTIALGNSPDKNISPDGRSPVAEYRGRAASGTPSRCLPHGKRKKDRRVGRSRLGRRICGMAAK
jgi:hypothetical protein